MAGSSGRSHAPRIAEVYVAIVPLLDNDFKRQLQNQIEQAIRGVNFDSLTNKLRQEGRQAGRAFRRAFESAANGIDVREDFSDEIRDARRGGRRTGNAFQNAVEGAVGNIDFLGSERDEVNEAGRIGRLAGGDFADNFRRASDIDSEVRRDLSGADEEAGAAGDRAGRSFRSNFEGEAGRARVDATGIGEPGEFRGIGRRLGEAFRRGFRGETENLVDTRSGGGEGIGSKIAGAVGGIGVLGVIKNGFDSTVDREANIQKLSSAVDANSTQSKNLESAYDSLIKRGFSGEEASEILRNISSSDRTLLNNRQELTAAATELAYISKTVSEDSDKIAQVAAQAMRNNLAGSTREAMQQISAGAQQLSPQLRDELVEQLEEYMNQNKSAGLSLAEQITFAVKNGKSGSAYAMDYGNDAIKELQNLVLDETNTAVADTLREIGLDPKKIRQGFLQGGEASRNALNDVVKHLLEIKDPTTRASKTMQLFGTPVEEMRKEGVGYDQFLENVFLINDGLGDTKKKMDDLTNSTANSFLMTMGQTVGLLSNALTQLFIPVLDYLKPKLDAFNNWARENPELLKIIVGVVIALAAVITTLLTIGAIGGLIALVQSGIGIVAGAAGAMASAFLGIIPSLATVGTAIGGILGGITLSGIGFGLLVGAAAVAALGLGVLVGSLISDYDGTLEFLRTRMGGFGNFLADSIEGWSMLFQGMWKGWTDGMPLVFQTVGNAIRDFFGGMEGWGGQVMASIGNYFIGVMNKIIDAINGVRWGWNKVSSLWGGNQLDMIDRVAPVLPKMATGGDVMGATALIAGEKEPETIVNRGLMNRHLEVLNKRLASNSVNDGIMQNIDITVMPAPGMDENLLAEKVIRKLARANRYAI